MIILDKHINPAILCVDPGPDTSGYVLFDGRTVLKADSKLDNEELLQSDLLKNRFAVIEMIDSYGMPVGKSVFQTILFIGRLIERIGIESCGFVYRREVKLFLCNSPRAKDSNIRQVIMDTFPATGGGKNPVVGTKKNPGPLYNVKSHALSALAVGLTAIYSGFWHVKTGKFTGILDFPIVTK